MTCLWSPAAPEVAAREGQQDFSEAPETPDEIAENWRCSTGGKSACGVLEAWYAYT